jgi:hypothetical protein
MVKLIPVSMPQNYRNAIIFGRTRLYFVSL